MPVSGSGPSRSFNLTAVQTAHLDYFTVQWAAADGSMLTTYAEVVGDFAFTVGRARQRSPLQDTSLYSTQNILDYRTLAEIALEDICGVAFVPRYRRDEATISGQGMLRVARRRIRNVVQITTMTNAGPQALPVLAGLRIMAGTEIFMPTLWNWWSMPVSVAYESGYDAYPPRVSRAALELARRWIVESPWDERMTGFRTRDGGEMNILTASHSDPFDLPEVVAVADAYGLPMVA